MKYTSPIFILAAEGNETIIRAAGDNRIDGIVTGIIVSFLVFPLLVISILFGLGMIFTAFTENSPFLIIMMGIMFSFGGFGLLRLFSGAMMSFFLFRWEVRRHEDSWELKKYIAGIRVFRKLCPSWSLECIPSYSRGDWGHCFLIRYDNRKVRMTPPSAFKSSKNSARSVAERDAAALQTHFGVECELLKWE